MNINEIAKIHLRYPKLCGDANVCMYQEHAVIMKHKTNVQLNCKILAIAKAIVKPIVMVFEHKLEHKYENFVSN